uniref:Uncharacterized protein n=1 Tax=Anopheles darlingi TaxID=43151 RepID=A0A2M4DF66_ANODA
MVGWLATLTLVVCYIFLAPFRSHTLAHCFFRSSSFFWVAFVFFGLKRRAHWPTWRFSGIPTDFVDWFAGRLKGN